MTENGPAEPKLPAQRAPSNMDSLTTYEKKRKPSKAQAAQAMAFSSPPQTGY
jgi:hypothetical protein